jgi:hypothetical protein
MPPNARQQANATATNSVSPSRARSENWRWLQSSFTMPLRRWNSG